jgi:hypothetical protein
MANPKVHPKADMSIRRVINTDAFVSFDYMPIVELLINSADDKFTNLPIPDDDADTNWSMKLRHFDTDPRFPEIMFRKSKITSYRQVIVAFMDEIELQHAKFALVALSKKIEDDKRVQVAEKVIDGIFNTYSDKLVAYHVGFVRNLCAAYKIAEERSAHKIAEGVGC